MTSRGMARQGVIALIACWLSQPLNAHVLNMGAIEPSIGVTGDAVRSAAQLPTAFEFGGPVVPWDTRPFDTFADVTPGVNAPVHSLYRDVLSIAGTPKLETWLALSIVVCLIGVQLRRTQRLLHHRPMAR